MMQRSAAGRKILLRLAESVYEAPANLALELLILTTPSQEEKAVCRWFSAIATIGVTGRVVIARMRGVCVFAELPEI